MCWSRTATSPIVRKLLVNLGCNTLICSASPVLCFAPGNLGMAPGMRVAQLLNIAFDMCAWEVLGSMMNGCTLCIRGSERHCWDDLLRTVDVVISTPSILASYPPEQYPNIQVAATAGEACSQTLADNWAAHAKFYNCCGPTEVRFVFAPRHADIHSYPIDHHRQHDCLSCGRTASFNRASNSE